MLPVLIQENHLDAFKTKYYIFCWFALFLTLDFPL